MFSRPVTASKVANFANALEGPTETALFMAGIYKAHSWRCAYSVIVLFNFHEHYLVQKLLEVQTDRQT